MDKYEYKIIDFRELRVGTRVIQGMLNELGENGWELIAIDKDMNHYFKRPLQKKCVQCDKDLTAYKYRYCSDKCQRSNRKSN